VIRLAGPYFWASSEKWKVLGLVGVLFGLVVLQVLVPILINVWNARLFDALEQRAMNEFFLLIGEIAAILVASVAINVSHLRVKRRVQLGWRRWLTRRLQDSWMAMGHHYQLNQLPGDHDNPDGRIAEDIRNTTENAIELINSLVYCGLLVISFINILWHLSEGITLGIGGREVPVPGFMVWLALIYTSVASGLALWAGQPLVRATYRRQAAEANFRFGLVRAREYSEGIALLHGEVGERRRFTDLFRGIEGAWNRQTRGLTRLFAFTSGYSVLSAAFPILVAAPRYITEQITLGQLMQTAQAFQQLSTALSWPVDNMQRVAEWRASAERVLALHDALQTLHTDAFRAEGETIVVEKSAEPLLGLHDLTIANTDGTVVLSRFSATIRPGERVLICGDPNAAVKLFKVVAGLWTWGSGTVSLPSDATVFFMPQRPYMPLGTLRAVLAYPSAIESYSDEMLKAALVQVGLAPLADRLRESQSWEQVLSIGEQQRLGFARLLLHRPRWVFLQEATDAVDPDSERRLMQILIDTFPSATVITVGFHPELDAYHGRRLVLSPNADGRIWVRDIRQEGAPPPSGATGWPDRLWGTLRRRNERRALSTGIGKHGDWRD